MAESLLARYNAWKEDVYVGEGEDEEVRVGFLAFDNFVNNLPTTRERLDDELDYQKHLLPDGEFFLWLNTETHLDVPENAIWCKICLDVPAKFKCKTCELPVCQMDGAKCTWCQQMVCPVDTRYVSSRDTYYAPDGKIVVCQGCIINRGLIA